MTDRWAAFPIRETTPARAASLLFSRMESSKDPDCSGSWLIKRLFNIVNFLIKLFGVCYGAWTADALHQIIDLLLTSRI